MAKNLAIIPIRSGSKRIKDKNIKLFNLEPLVHTSVKVALSSKLFDKIVISSDSDNYLKLVNNKFSKNRKIHCIKRPKNISQNLSSTELTINHVLNKIENFENIFLIQATSPLLQKSDLINGFKKFNKDELDSLFSCYMTKSFIWSIENNNLKSENYNYKKRPMSQKFKNKQIIENGAFYIFNYKKYLKFKNRLFGKIGFYEMNKYFSVDIDNEKDFKLAEYISKNKNFFKNLKNKN